MLFSYKLLSELVDLSSLTPEKVRDRLTFSGFEVEDMEPLASASKLCIGKILTCEKHPESDHLHLLTVDLGSTYGIKNIVCGAPNARAGIKVIVALEGCVLPALNETIKKGVIRGKESDGMCCSLLELGVKADSLDENSPSKNGIEELDDDAEIGNTDVLAYLGLDDTVFDINVLPNRPDCLSYYGMAREISALLNVKMKDAPTFDFKSISKKLNVSSETNACNRFDILRITDVKVKSETPKKIKNYLTASGIRPVSPIVDIGNYAMLLSGQPFNMYDASKNEAGTYVVKDDFDDVKVKTFDEKELTLKKDDLVVTDSKNPLCVAGIMALDSACVTSNTTSFDIEAGIFYHVNIRHSSSRLGLSSPSSQLFGKERNPLMVDEALAIIVSLLDEFLDSYKVEAYGSFNNVNNDVKGVEFSLDKLNHRLGGNYTEAEVDEVLKAYRVKKIDGLLYPPVDRVDLLEQCDFEEEVYRYFGAERLIATFKNYPITTGGLSPEQRKRREIREMLISLGFDEILSFTLIDEKMDKMIRVFNNFDSYKLVNPMTKDHEIVRSDLLPSMLQTMDYNITHNNPDLKLFEISNVDNPKAGSHLYLSLGLLGKHYVSENYDGVEYNFFDIKGIITSIFNKIGVPETRYRLMYSKNTAFHPYASVDIYVGKDFVGTFGRVHPSLRKDNVYLAEIDLGYLLALKGLKTKFTKFSSETMVRRDISFKSKDDVSYKKLIDTIKSVKDTNLDHVSLFDKFSDDNNDTFIGVSLYFQREGKTLKGEEIDDSVSRIINAVKANLGLSRRGE